MQANKVPRNTHTAMSGVRHSTFFMPSQAIPSKTDITANKQVCYHGFHSNELLPHQVGRIPVTTPSRHWQLIDIEQHQHSTP